MKVVPVGARLLVLPINDERKSTIILDVKTERKLTPYVRGVVVGRGAGSKNYPMTEFRQNGKEIVWYPRNSGVHVEIDKVDHILLHVSDLVAIDQTVENK